MVVGLGDTNNETERRLWLEMLTISTHFVLKFILKTKFFFDYEFNKTMRYFMILLLGHILEN